MFIIGAIAATALLYLWTQEERITGIFPEELGDMNLALYREGNAAMSEVKSLHRGLNFELENAYIANYRSSSGSKAKFWVSESKSSEEAESLLAAMNSRVGKTGMFSESTSENIEGTTIYFVTGLGEYHYFWVKDNRVIWVQINNSDKAYQLDIVKESLERV